MKNIYYLVFAIVSIFVIVSCSTDSTPIYQLTTNAEPAEAGTVTPSSGEYDEGEQVQITATPNEHWVFDSWSGGVSGSTNPASFTMDSDKSITAMFVKRDYPLTINTQGEGEVSERVVEAKTTDYPHGTTVELTANPADGWEFVEWQGDLSSSVNPETITVEKEKSVIASFAEIFYNVDISLVGEGTVNETLIEGEETENGYTFGSKIEIEVGGDGDYSFVHWDGELEGTDNPMTITIEGDITATAVLDNSPFAGGSGSELYPYQVSTVEQLQEIKNYSNKDFVQINNIDANNTSTWNDGKGFRPIGDEIIKFSGSYNGQGYRITGLTINRDDQAYIALFGYTEESKFTNIYLDEVNITGYSFTGGLIGNASSGASLVQNCTVSGNIYGKNEYVGGLIGLNRGNVIDSFSDVNVTGWNGVGGLIGFQSGSNSKVVNSYSSGTVTGSSGSARTIGGLIGVNFSLVSKSFSTSNVYGGDRVGGLIGTSQTGGLISESFSKGDVSGNTDIGGLVGRNWGGEINNSYSTANVNGTEAIGGLVGINMDSNQEVSYIIKSYSYGQVNGDTDVGGVVGVNAAIIESSYWDTKSTEQEDGIGRGNSDGATGLTATEMQGTAAQENMPEFDWNNIWITTGGYPKLRWQE